MLRCTFVDLIGTSVRSPRWGRHLRAFAGTVHRKRPAGGEDFAERYRQVASA